MLQPNWDAFTCCRTEHLLDGHFDESFRPYAAKAGGLVTLAMLNCVGTAAVFSLRMHSRDAALLSTVLCRLNSMGIHHQHPPKNRYTSAISLKYIRGTFVLCSVLPWHVQQLSPCPTCMCFRGHVIIYYCSGVKTGMCSSILAAC